MELIVISGLLTKIIGEYVEMQQEKIDGGTFMDSMEKVFIILVTIAVAALILVVYFIPTVIANRRQCADKTIIFVVNLLLGITLIGWVGSFIWSLVGETEIQRREKQELQSIQLAQARMMMNSSMQNWNMMNNGMQNGNMMNNGMLNGNMMNNGMPNGMMNNGMLNSNMMNGDMQKTFNEQNMMNENTN